MSVSALIIRYFASEITAENVLKIAATNDQRTEAHAYIGEDLRMKWHSDKALPHFQWVMDFGNRNFTEYPLAVAALRRL